MWQMWALGNTWTSKPIMQGSMVNTVDLWNIQKIFWISAISIMCREKLTNFPEKIRLYQLTPVSTKKAKDERNISPQSMYTKLKN